MADKYESKYTGAQIDSYLDDVANLKDQQVMIEEEVGKISDKLNENVGERLNILEKWMKAENYTEITVSATETMATVLFGDSIENQTISWTISKEATSIKITLPNGNTVDVSELDTVDLSGKGTSQYKDKTKYQVTSPLTWKITATEKDGKDTVDEDGLPVTECRTVTANTSVAMQYFVFWGIGTRETDFSETFIKSLYNTKTTSKNRTLSFESVSGKYVYYAVPKTMCTTEPKFDINGDGFVDNFEKMPEITLTFNGASIVYYLYRSTNLLTSEEDFKVVVS